MHLLEILVCTSCPSNSGNCLHLFLKNKLLQVEVLESGSNVMIRCRLLTAITECVYCEAWYGTDPSHHVLPYHETSDNAGVGEMC